VYRWLTQDERHLKSNCKRNPPYDWSDITENAKFDAITKLCTSDDAHTSQYWGLAEASRSDNCPNWIARWFLYHKFRYRDGRNKGRDGEDFTSGIYDDSERRDKTHVVSSPYSQAKGCHGKRTLENCSGGPKNSGSRDPYFQNESLKSSAPTTTTSYTAAGQYNYASYGYTDGSGDKFYDPVKGWVSK